MKPRECFVSVLAFALPFLIYVPTLSGWFLGDDYGFYAILNMSADDMLKCLRWIYEGELRLHPFRPVAFLSFLIDYRIWGWNSFGFHLTNSLLHLANTVLVFILFINLRMNRLASFIGAMFFGLYPAFSEPVIWISCRFDLLSQFFFLLSLIFWIRGRLNSNSVLMLLSVIAYLLSLFSKETLAAGILLFPLIDWLIFRPRSNDIGNRIFRLGWLSAQLIALSTVFSARFWLYGNFSGDVGITRRQQFCGTTLAEGVERLWQDLWMSITPVSRLVFPSLIVWLAGIMIAAFMITAVLTTVRNYRRHDYHNLKLLIFGVIWIVLLISTTLFVDPVEIYLDNSRYMYTPCVGLALIVGISVNDYYNSHGQLFKWMIILFALWFVFSSVLLWQYNKVSYIEAGRVVRDVDRVLYENTLNIDHGDMIIVVDLPWLWNGAHFAPNGYSAYLQEIHQKWQLNLTYIEKGEEGISQAWLDRLQEAKFKRYYVFLWNKDRQILEPVVTY